MDITPLIPQGRQIIQAYGAGGFTVSGVRYEGSVLVLPQRCISIALSELSQLSEEMLAPLMQPPKPELLLVGCGAAIGVVRPSWREFPRRHAIALDVMDTGAACRTFNVLAGEERRAAAILIAV